MLYELYRRVGVVVNIDSVVSDFEYVADDDRIELLPQETDWLILDGMLLFALTLLRLLGDFML